MMVRVKTLTAGIVLTTFILVVFQMNSASGDSVPISYQDIAAELLNRGNASTEGIVHYRSYNFRVSTDTFDEIAQLLMESQDAPELDIISQTESWLDANLPTERAAWEGEIAFQPDQWLDVKNRMQGVDTVPATFAALAQAEGMEPAPTANKVVRHSDSNIVTIVRDGLSVIRKTATGSVHPLMPMDISLADWQKAMDLGANVEGQQISGEAEGPIRTITYTNDRGDGSWVSTSYSFHSDLDWAPAQVRTYDEDGTMRRIMYGYAPTSSEQLARPQVVAKGMIGETGDVQTTVSIIDDWQESSDPADVELREPAIYLELNYTDNDDHTPVVTAQQPDYLVGVEPCSRLEIAIINVIQAIGTDDPNADYNYDGVVDEADIDAAMQRFGS